MNIKLFKYLYIYIFIYAQIKLLASSYVLGFAYYLILLISLTLQPLNRNIMSYK